MLSFDGLEGTALEAAQAECILAKIGNAIAWIFAPLGWGNWKMTVAAITGSNRKRERSRNIRYSYSDLQKLQKTEQKSGVIWQAA